MQRKIAEIPGTVLKIFQEAKKQGKPTEEVAIQIAKDRILEHRKGK